MNQRGQVKQRLFYSRNTEAVCNEEEGKWEGAPNMFYCVEVQMNPPRKDVAA